ncbi:MULTISPECIES: hypothetical protein [Photobacterium]|uniref:DUF1127 domain-containing protein n=1 Tax=Photobacterium ganghwense TaxID=320778 RepID=A0A0J1H7A3_9GAMM|nr:MULTISPECIES: hypothetical protein [Photobacterium]KLV07598.1 hypothetical protein ABT57_17035 [Photobacterium ganghwense]MBV1843300.1 hypothetical protein [Photobacterium ganghwense]PSU11550.1 hypothetical protein C9I92_05520 [Photobacterium ganghwense]QSV13666.1 hypothetical protein FH974_13135 [Photobacterium ganghwense]
MRQSVYLRLAVFFIQLDLQREAAQWRHEHRRIQVHIPHLSVHIRRDIGIDKEQFIASDRLLTPAGRKTQRLRNKYRSRLVT